MSHMRSPVGQVLYQFIYDRKNFYAAHVRYDFRLNEISEYLGIHYTTVGKAIKHAERK